MALAVSVYTNVQYYRCNLKVNKKKKREIDWATNKMILYVQLDCCNYMASRIVDHGNIIFV